MTGLLKDLMHDKADHAGTPHVDLDAIVAAGDRRVRRRRVVTGAGVLVAAAAVVAAVAVVPGTIDDSAKPVQPSPDRVDQAPFDEELPTYADGSTIHYGTTAIDVSPHQVWNFATSDHAFVFSADDRHAYLTDGEGEPVDLGRSDQTVLAEGPYAAYVSLAGDRPEVVVRNTVDDAEVLRTSAGVDPGAQKADETRVVLLALDGSQLYWHNSQGVVVSDLSAPNDDPIVLQPNASTIWLWDVARGVLARESFDDITVTVSRDTDATSPNFEGDTATLSPDASHVATVSGEELRVYDVATGRDVTPKAPAFAQTRLVNWLSGNTFVMAGANDYGGNAVLLECSARSGTCEPQSTEIGVFGSLITPTNG